MATKKKIKCLVVVDVQKDFVDGALGAEGNVAITERIASLADKFAKDGNAVIFTKDTHVKTEFGADGKPIAGYLTTLEGKRLPVEHCIFGTEGHELAGGVKAVYDRLKNGYCNEDAFCVWKSTFACPENDFMYAVGSTTLLTHQELDDEDTEFIFCGFCTDICVISNALLVRSRFGNAKVTIREDLCAGTSKSAHDAALTVAKSCFIDVKGEEA